MTFQFYEKVKVLSCPEFPDRVGQFGYVLGRSYEGDDPERGAVCGYSVFFDDVGQCCGFAPAELAGTGEVAQRSEFYSGESVRVRVVDGKGFLVEE